jgi:hypothetical protein
MAYDQEAKDLAKRLYEQYYCEQKSDDEEPVLIVRKRNRKTKKGSAKTKYEREQR